MRSPQPMVLWFGLVRLVAASLSRRLWKCRPLSRLVAPPWNVSRLNLKKGFPYNHPGGHLAFSGQALRSVRRGTILRLLFVLSESQLIEQASNGIRVRDSSRYTYGER